LVYLITGRKGAGKTTRARILAHKIRQENKQVLILDGDDVRQYFPTGFTDEDRRNHILHMAKIAALAEAQGIVTIIACVSPMREWRRMVKDTVIDYRQIYIPGGTLWKSTIYEEPGPDGI